MKIFRFGMKNKGIGLVCVDNFRDSEKLLLLKFYGLGLQAGLFPFVTAKLAYEERTERDN